uniref:AlNc14C47G3794 protein n=1 Tax=Albugo laibachii Nc14 TaxID=890382 RepID=F0WAT1_9STRA|nr:AlNc14C47G3794 [Albugo laibachii Nc14]|eukprot:CCA18253.1 AlNc14C47G3794 [Albugo laibachii Nc14]
MLLCPRSRLTELNRRVTESDRTRQSSKSCHSLILLTNEMQQDCRLSNSLARVIVQNPTQKGDVYLRDVIEDEGYTWLDVPWFLAELYLFDLIQGSLSILKQESTHFIYSRYIHLSYWDI